MCPQTAKVPKEGKKQRLFLALCPEEAWNRMLFVLFEHFAVFYDTRLAQLAAKQQDGKIEKMRVHKI